MHRIDTPTAQKDKFGVGKNGFTGGDPQTGTPATALDSDMFDSLQEEISGVVEGAGLTLDKANNAQLLAAIKALMSVGEVPDVGELRIYKTNAINPNTKWPGTTWELLPPGVNLRTGAADGSDVGTTVGADTVTLIVDNLPSHDHGIGDVTGDSAAVGITTDGTDLGTVNTAGGGGHGHAFEAANHNPSLDGGTSEFRLPQPGIGAVDEGLIAAVGDHTHPVTLGAHVHTATLPAHNHTLPSATAATGSGTAVSIVPTSMLIMAWVRTA